MADHKTSELTSYTSPIDTDILPVVDITTPETKKITWANIKATLKTYFDTVYTNSLFKTYFDTIYEPLGTSPVKASKAEVIAGTDDAKFVTAKAMKEYANLPDGTLLNGKIVVTVASNNLTVALKGMDGNDPSATNPIYYRIGNTIRSITAALSTTLNAGTNWFNAGSASLATKEIDYFVYLHYDSGTSATEICFSRISYGRLGSDFSSTNTEDRYIANALGVDATDEVINIGRFAATLSAGAGYTWTVPTFTSINLIQRPIYDTRWLTWAPVYTGFSSDPATPKARYLIRGRSCLAIYEAGSASTSNANTFTISVPINPGASTPTTKIVCTGLDNGSAISNAFVYIVAAATAFILEKTIGVATSWTTSNRKDVYFAIEYEI